MRPMAYSRRLSSPDDKIIGKTFNTPQEHRQDLYISSSVVCISELVQKIERSNTGEINIPSSSTKLLSTHRISSFKSTGAGRPRMSTRRCRSSALRNFWLVWGLCSKKMPIFCSTSNNIPLLSSFWRRSTSGDIQSFSSPPSTNNWGANKLGARN